MTHSPGPFRAPGHLNRPARMGAPSPLRRWLCPAALISIYLLIEFIKAVTILAKIYPNYAAGRDRSLGRVSSSRLIVDS